MAVALADFVWCVVCVCAGACVGEGDTNQRVHVHYGSKAEDPVDVMVRQAVHLPLHLCHHNQHSSQGKTKYSIQMLMLFHILMSRIRDYP